MFHLLLKLFSIFFTNNKNHLNLFCKMISKNTKSNILSLNPSSNQTPFNGLYNNGCNCFFNSCLHIFLHDIYLYKYIINLQFYRENFIQHPTNTQETQLNNLLRYDFIYFVLTYHTINNNLLSPDQTILYKYVNNMLQKHSKTDTYSQHDSHEAFTIIINKLFNCFQTIHENNNLFNNYSFTINLYNCKLANTYDDFIHILDIDTIQSNHITYLYINDTTLIPQIIDKIKNKTNIQITKTLNEIKQMLLDKFKSNILHINNNNINFLVSDINNYLMNLNKYNFIVFNQIPNDKHMYISLNIQSEESEYINIYDYINNYIVGYYYPNDKTKLNDYKMQLVYNLQKFITFHIQLLSDIQKQIYQLPIIISIFDNLTNNQLFYKLYYLCIFHKGTLNTNNTFTNGNLYFNSGHYTCYVNIDNEWYDFNDSTCTKVQLQTQNNYYIVDQYITLIIYQLID